MIRILTPRRITQKPDATLLVLPDRLFSKFKMSPAILYVCLIAVAVAACMRTCVPVAA